MKSGKLYSMKGFLFEQRVHGEKVYDIIEVQEIRKPPIFVSKRLLHAGNNCRVKYVVLK